MSRLDTSVPDDVPVRVGDCECAGHPHDGQDGHDDGDIVWLKPGVDLDLGLAIEAARGSALPRDDEGKVKPISVAAALHLIEKAMGSAYIAYGVTRWNFLNDDGTPIDLTPDNAVRALPWDKGGALVAERADDLYSPAVTAPLLARQRQLSAPGPTASSTSRTPRRKAGTRRPSRSSSAPASAGTSG